MFGRRKYKPTRQEAVESIESGYSQGWRHVMDTRAVTGQPFDYDGMAPTIDVVNRHLAGDENFVKAFFMGASDATDFPVVDVQRPTIAAAFARRRQGATNRNNGAATTEP